MEFISQRLKRVKPSQTLMISARAANLKALGHDIIGLGAGEPDFDTPEHIKEATTKALVDGKTKYTPVQGTLPLRKAIVEKFKRDNDIDYEPDQIIVGVGAKHIIFNAFLATVDSHDEVIIPAPYWVSYPDMVEVAEGTAIFIRCKPENHLKLTPDSLADVITTKSKWLILNSPSNPTGMAYTEKELLALAEIIRDTPHLHVLCDDIYEYLVYDKFKFKTLAQVAPDLKDRILTVNGVSKSYAMTGWRIGYGAGPRELIEAMTALQSHSTSNATSIAQEASIVAIQGNHDFLKEWIVIYEERRDKAIDILNAIPGVSCIKPNGAFYLYANCTALMGKKTPMDSIITSDTDFAAYLLESAGVAVVPGIAFGLSPYFRVSFATSTDLLVEACHRISQAVSLLK